MSPTIREVRSRYRELALETGFSPRDIDLLISDALGRPFEWVLGHDDESIDPQTLARLAERIVLPSLA